MWDGYACLCMGLRAGGGMGVRIPYPHGLVSCTPMPAMTPPATPYHSTEPTSLAAAHPIPTPSHTRPYAHTQNVVSFSVIPDLYPKNRATALALYNCAIYVGRGLMYHIFNSGSKGSGAAGAVGAAASSIAEPHVTTTAAEAAVAAVEGGGRAAGMTAVFDSSGNL